MEDSGCCHLCVQACVLLARPGMTFRPQLKTSSKSYIRSCSSQDKSKINLSSPILLASSAVLLRINQILVFVHPLSEVSSCQRSTVLTALPTSTATRPPPSLPNSIVSPSRTTGRKGLPSTKISVPAWPQLNSMLNSATTSAVSRVGRHCARPLASQTFLLRSLNAKR